MIKDLGVGPTIDNPHGWVARVTLDNGEYYSLDGLINAMVDVRLEKYFTDNGIRPESETFDKLKYTEAELKLRKLIKGS